MVRWPRDYVTTPTPIRFICTPMISSALCRTAHQQWPTVIACAPLHQASPAIGEHVVHIGTGTGYYTAILAHLVWAIRPVTGIEYEPELAREPKPISRHTQTSISSRATAPGWLRSIRPMSFTSCRLHAAGRNWLDRLAMAAA